MKDGSQGHRREATSATPHVSSSFVAVTMLFPKGRKPREADDTMTNKEEQEEIDLALDAALDELDDEEVNESPPSVEDVASISAKPAADSTAENPSPSTADAKKAAPVVMGPPRPPVVEDGDPEKMISDMMEQMLGMQQQGGDASDDFIGQLMQGMQSQISSEIENLDAATPPPSTPPKQSTPVQVQAPAPVAPASTKGPVKSSEGGVDEAISSLLEGMASEKLSDDGIGGSPSMPGETDLLESLMQGLGGGDTEGMNADTVIDGMMEQLMAKDLMYEPIKQFATNFPPWLEERKATMSEEEYAR